MGSHGEGTRYMGSTGTL
jgi:hypothetical protein